jgi:hypothetical protein
MALLATEIDLPRVRGSDLIGTWYIVRTTFPMWRNGKNSHPALNYSRIPGSEDSLLDDRVSYRRNGKPREIRGIDRQDSELSCHFIWRGRGLLSLLTSEWYVVDFDRAAKVMAIYFSKTLFTPAGLDIATNSPTPDPATVAACEGRVRAAASLRPHADALVDIRHD